MYKKLSLQLYEFYAPWKVNSWIFLTIFKAIMERKDNFLFSIFYEKLWNLEFSS